MNKKFVVAGLLFWTMLAMSIGAVIAGGAEKTDRQAALGGPSPALDTVSTPQGAAMEWIDWWSTLPYLTAGQVADGLTQRTTPDATKERERTAKEAADMRSDLAAACPLRIRGRCRRRRGTRCDTG